MGQTCGSGYNGCISSECFVMFIRNLLSFIREFFVQEARNVHAPHLDGRVPPCSESVESAPRGAGWIDESVYRW